MSSVTVVAILDRPSSRSFARLAYVERLASGRLRIVGLLGHRREHISQREVDELCNDGHALAVQLQLFVPHDANRRGRCLGWVGKDLQAKCLEHRVPSPTELPPKRRLNTISDKGADVWLASPGEVLRRQDRWVKAIATRAVQTNNPDIARLAQWALPDSPFAEAAIWKTSARRDEELSWYARLARDNGRPVDEEALEREFRKICRGLLRDPSRAEPFTSRPAVPPKELKELKEPSYGWI